MAITAVTFAKPGQKIGESKESQIRRAYTQATQQVGSSGVVGQTTSEGTFFTKSGSGQPLTSTATPTDIVVVKTQTGEKAYTTSASGKPITQITPESAKTVISQADQYRTQQQAYAKQQYANTSQPVEETPKPQSIQNYRPSNSILPSAYGQKEAPKQAVDMNQVNPYTGLRPGTPVASTSNGGVLLSGYGQTVFKEKSRINTPLGETINYGYETTAPQNSIFKFLSSPLIGSESVKAGPIESFFNKAISSVDSLKDLKPSGSAVLKSLAIPYSLKSLQTGETIGNELNNLFIKGQQGLETTSGSFTRSLISAPLSTGASISRSLTIFEGPSKVRPISGGDIITDIFVLSSLAKGGIKSFLTYETGTKAANVIEGVGKATVIPRAIITGAGIGAGAGIIGYQVATGQTTIPEVAGSAVGYYGTFKGIESLGGKAGNLIFGPTRLVSTSFTQSIERAKINPGNTPERTGTIDVARVDVYKNLFGQKFYKTIGTERAFTKIPEAGTLTESATLTDQNTLQLSVRGNILQSLSRQQGKSNIFLTSSSEAIKDVATIKLSEFGSGLKDVGTFSTNTQVIRTVIPRLGASPIISKEALGSQGTIFRTPLSDTTIFNQASGQQGTLREYYNTFYGSKYGLKESEPGQLFSRNSFKGYFTGSGKSIDVIKADGTIDMTAYLKSYSSSKDIIFSTPRQTPISPFARLMTSSLGNKGSLFIGGDITGTRPSIGETGFEIITPQNQATEITPIRTKPITSGIISIPTPSDFFKIVSPISVGGTTGGNVVGGIYGGIKPTTISITQQNILTQISTPLSREGVTAQDSVAQLLSQPITTPQTISRSRTIPITTPQVITETITQALTIPGTVPFNPTSPQPTEFNAPTLPFFIPPFGDTGNLPTRQGSKSGYGLLFGRFVPNLRGIESRKIERNTLTNLNKGTYSGLEVRGLPFDLAKSLGYKVPGLRKIGKVKRRRK